MTDNKIRDSRKEAYGRTVYSGLKTVSISLNALKHESQFKDKQKIGQVEVSIDAMLSKIKSVSIKKGDNYEEIEKQFDEIAAFIFELQAIASIMPTDKGVYDRVLDGFGELCKKEIDNYLKAN